MEVLKLLIGDLVELGYAMRITDWAVPIGIAMWLGIVFLPIVRLDVRDVFCGMTYMVFHVGVGVALVLAIPAAYLPPMSFKTHTLIVLIMFGVVAARWYFRKEAIDLVKAQYNEFTSRRQQPGGTTDRRDS